MSRWAPAITYGKCNRRSRRSFPSRSFVLPVAGHGRCGSKGHDEALYRCSFWDDLGKSVLLCFLVGTATAMSSSSSLSSLTGALGISLCFFAGAGTGVFIVLVDWSFGHTSVLLDWCRHWSLHYHCRLGCWAYLCASWLVQAPEFHPLPRVMCWSSATLGIPLVSLYEIELWTGCTSSAEFLSRESSIYGGVVVLLWHSAFSGDLSSSVTLAWYRLDSSGFIPHQNQMDMSDGQLFQAQLFNR